MSWVRRSSSKPPTHTCHLPDTGTVNDLWRCDNCGILWQRRMACADCQYRLRHSMGVRCGDLTWYLAPWWTELRHLFDGWGKRQPEV